MKKLYFIIALAIILNIKLYAQNETSDDGFQPSGSPFAKIFTNFHSTYTDGEHSNLFELKRAYLGYDYKFSKNFSGKVTFDVGNPGVGSLEMTAYVKNALLKYKSENLTVNFGLIGTNQFSLQEKNWGYRYIFKSFQDQHKFGFSADLGLSVDYKFADIVSADFSILNGEGYKTAMVDTIVKISLGTTLKLVKDLSVRVYYDFMGTDTVQQTLSLFAVYHGKSFSLGGEFNNQVNNKYVNEQDYSGYSFYSTYHFNEKVKIFGRYDKLSSVKIGNSATSWNYSKDGQLFIFGIEYVSVKGVKISPNYQGWDPEDDSKPLISSVFFNCEIKF